MKFSNVNYKVACILYVTGYACMTHHIKVHIDMEKQGWLLRLGKQGICPGAQSKRAPCRILQTKEIFNFLTFYAVKKLLKSAEPTTFYYYQQL